MSFISSNDTDRGTWTEVLTQNLQDSETINLQSAYSLLRFKFNSDYTGSQPLLLDDLNGVGPDIDVRYNDGSTDTRIAVKISDDGSFANGWMECSGDWVNGWTAHNRVGYNPSQSVGVWLSSAISGPLSSITFDASDGGGGTQDIDVTVYGVNK